MNFFSKKKWAGAVMGIFLYNPLEACVIKETSLN